MRRKKYTARGISRVPCVKCGNPSSRQWRICATNAWSAVCKVCDVEINRIVATWAFGKRKGQIIVKAYERTLS